MLLFSGICDLEITCSKNDIPINKDFCIRSDMKDLLIRLDDFSLLFLGLYWEKKVLSKVEKENIVK